MHASAQHKQQDAVRRFAFLYQGTLLHKAEVRTKLLDGTEHSVPVVCIDVELDNDLHTHMHVERPYAPDQRAQAELDAAALKRGTHVSIEAAMPDVRIVVRNAAQVTPIPAIQTRQEPDLWQS